MPRRLDAGRGVAALTLLLTLLVLGVADLTTLAQTAPSTPVPADGRTLLLQAGLTGLPNSPVAVELLRLELAPGAVSAPHRHPGPELGVVERGY